MVTVEIPIKDKKKPPVLKFPDRCVHCGKPKQTVMPMTLHMGVENRGQGVLMEFPVPMCTECEAMERRIAYVTLVPFVIVGLLLCGIVFVPVWLIAPDGTTPQTMGFSVTAGVLAGMIAGLIGGTVVEFCLKFLFAPMYGRLLLKRPLTVFGLLNDSENVVGLSAKFTKDKKSLKLIFENDEVAKEFEGLNSQERK